MNTRLSFSRKYTESSFWRKLQKFAKNAGTKVVYVALLLYYVLQSSNVPLKAKAVIIGALGYFIAPIDAIPDIMVGIGYADDFSILLGALVSVAMYVDKDVKEKAHNRIAAWFGSEAEEDVQAIDTKLDTKTQSSIS
ncbi:YkvA family protein [Paenibacillus eucommiae]|uniref:Uncharacterized membrane protein YkvA (DUF1232 family) n=1 Tax=Paenibacillus eucommiae TaxID=1355755 RepID=A0ABS4J7M8_9BACL|nr:YkvA family protein [Paenibacillus eucommiae]MBP1995856.1 uncharacterized membrane protein YkvA (DUF1232 family) [Paenibacillus eucommiae]